jgi:aminoglycoside 3-N-acetyltransferase
MKRRSAKELAALLDDLGIRRGDRVMAHTFLPAIGVVEGGLAGFEAVLREAVGPDGAVIVPTFTYSFRRGEVFDPAESPSTVGAFTEHLRKRADAVRSACPLFSMATVGEGARRLMARPSTRCFGEGSVFATLFAEDVKFAGFGVDWDQGYTFFMHLERLAEVPFRRDRVFRGETRRPDGGLIDDEAVHFVRDESVPWRRDRGPYCRELAARGVVQEIVRDGCPFRLFDSRVAGPVVLARLREDPWCMAERPS